MAYDGGKAGAGVYQRIINEMPPHMRYIEPFAGGFAIGWAKAPAWGTIAIDADAQACAAISGDARSAGIPDLQVRNMDGIAWLEEAGAYYGPETLIYCDPPYLLSTRRQHRRMYRYELECADHVRLLAVLRRLRCLVMISGYWSELYADELAGWRAISFQAMTRQGPATEWLWMNFPEPTELHDYRYLGEDFRERERIKRKRDRWVRRLRSMPVLERRLLSAALAEVSDVSSREAIQG